MEYSFPICNNNVVKKKMLVELKYTIKAHQINLSTYIYAVSVTLVD